MRVTRDTPDHLILTDSPWLIGIGLILFILVFAGIGLLLLSEGIWAGLIFLFVGGGLGLGAFVVFVRRVQVVIDRPVGRLTIQRQSVFGYDRVHHDLADLASAELQQMVNQKGEVLQRPVLIFDGGMSAGRHPIVAPYTNTAGPERLVDAINGWLAAHRPVRVDSAPPSA